MGRSLQADRCFTVHAVVGPLFLLFRAYTPLPAIGRQEDRTGFFFPMYLKATDNTG